MFGDFTSYANFRNFETSKHRFPTTKFTFSRIFIRKALLERGFTRGCVGLDEKAEDDAASRRATAPSPPEIGWLSPRLLDAPGGFFGVTEGCANRSTW
jgi:hypothetical protein